jgi:hypothetical protein
MRRGPKAQRQMNGGEGEGWREHFGFEEADGRLFVSKTDFLRGEKTSAQPHILRRAFELLDLDAIFSSGTAPLVYFKTVDSIAAADVARLHRNFWNHGGAPILVLVALDEVHVYSSLVSPEPDTVPRGALVETLSRVSADLRDFLPAVESGEFFRRHAPSFDPDARVDRALLNNLESTRKSLLAMDSGALEPRVVDALLCRLVFACYLFDRGIVGESYLTALGLGGAAHLRDILRIRPTTKARGALYKLFQKLGEDFNGDLFAANLSTESKLVSAAAIERVDEFFCGISEHGQQAFWPYDFKYIPVEAVSAIYERFLHADAREEGSYYTPRYLAENVLDVALAKAPSLLGLRYLDPACGSGIFLVGLFNRIAEEWRRLHPGAQNDRRARELRTILCTNLAGVDINPTACRITAFSLYLAYLDQLSPRDIQEFQQKGHKLPRLVRVHPFEEGEVEGNIWCGDFFASDEAYPRDVDIVVGNPPWGSTATDDTLAAIWAADGDRFLPLPDKQIATAFMWKAADHVRPSGGVCLILPHGTVFNQSSTALAFQRAFFRRYAVELVLNLVDYQFFLFSEARHPAIVMRYRNDQPNRADHVIEYWAPKADWLVMLGEVIAIAPEDRSRVPLTELLADLDEKDAPQIWKQRYWATSRDRRLLSRLSLYPRLRDRVRLLREPAFGKPWVMAVGLQPVRQGDDPTRSREVELPSRRFVEASSSRRLSLFLLAEDCATLPEASFTARDGSNTDTTVFRAPHVLVTKGFTGVAFADFDVAFQDFLRGIHGPQADRELLILLAAYLGSPLAKYFLFHTSSNWGVTRQQIHVNELLRLPFIAPDDTRDQTRAWGIVRKVVDIMESAAGEVARPFSDRDGIVVAAHEAIEPLLNEYFDVLPEERVLVQDTLNVSVPSFRPTRRRRSIPTIQPSTSAERNRYVQRVCETLNDWATGLSRVHGEALASTERGIGVAVLKKTAARAAPRQVPQGIEQVLAQLRDAVASRLNTFELFRGVKVFDGDLLYIVKPMARRFWTETAALNDADEIVGTILMHEPREMAWQ